jgi:two-component system, OmpR family, sensor histidine kinase BaeS
LVGLSALNPDAFIARRNLERYARTGDLDVAELRVLSPDAVPVLTEAFGSLDRCARLEVSALLHETAGTAEGYGWASWNLGRERAADAIAAWTGLATRATPVRCG